LKKGSKEAKAWGAKMKRLRGKPKKRKTTTRKRRTTRKGDLTLKRKKAYPLTIRVRKRGSKGRQKRTDSAWSF
jgi:hypothetical protein